MIRATRKQRTIRKPAVLVGFGYWSGQDVTVEFRPADVDTGYIFVREDVDPDRSVPACLANRIETPRRTTIQCGRSRIEMIEHILAALSGLRIDNCEIVVNASEMPAMDGSSLAAAEVLMAAGICEQPAMRTCFSVEKPIRIEDGGSWIEARPSATGDFSIGYRLDYGQGTPIGRQEQTVCVTPGNFYAELASARTFVLKQEADAMQAVGVGSRVTFENLLVFDDRGPINNALRFPDECVRHKILDIVGDLALLGCDLSAEIVAHRTGHRHNAALVEAITQQRYNSPRLEYTS